MSAVDSWEICSQRGSRTAQTRTEERPRLLPGFVFCMGRSLCSPNPTPHAPGQSEEASATVLGPQSSTGRRRERVMHGRARAGSTAAKSGWSSSACVAHACVRAQVHVGLYVTARLRVHAHLSSIYRKHPEAGALAARSTPVPHFEPKHKTICVRDRGGGQECGHRKHVDGYCLQAKCTAFHLF